MTDPQMTICISVTSQEITADLDWNNIGPDYVGAILYRLFSGFLSAELVTALGASKDNIEVLKAWKAGMEGHDTFPLINPLNVVTPFGD